MSWGKRSKVWVDKLTPEEETQLDSKFGFENYTGNDVRTGWLVNTQQVR